MSVAVKISDGEMRVLRDAARVNSRSIAGQAENWLRIGRAVERDPTLSYSRIDLALRGLEPLDFDTLDDAQQDSFIERMTTEPSDGAQDFWRDRRARGVGVGLDEHGELELGDKTRSR